MCVSVITSWSNDREDTVLAIMGPLFLTERQLIIPKRQGLDLRKYPHTMKEKNKQVTAFAGKLDPLSNFYPCEIRVFGVKHRSAEHAYQYSKAIECRKDTIANRILEADTAYHAKTEASYFFFFFFF